LGAPAAIGRPPSSCWIATCGVHSRAIASRLWCARAQLRSSCGAAAEQVLRGAPWHVGQLVRAPVHRVLCLKCTLQIVKTIRNTRMHAQTTERRSAPLRVLRLHARLCGSSARTHLATRHKQQRTSRAPEVAMHTADEADADGIKELVADGVGQLEHFACAASTENGDGRRVEKLQWVRCGCRKRSWGRAYCSDCLQTGGAAAAVSAEAVRWQQAGRRRTGLEQSAAHTHTGAGTRLSHVEAYGLGAQGIACLMQSKHEDCILRVHTQTCQRCTCRRCVSGASAGGVFGSRKKRHDDLPRPQHADTHKHAQH